MNKLYTYITRGLRVIGVITVKIPAIIADGKITIAELGSLMQSICDAGDWTIEIEIPSELGEEYVAVRHPS